MFFLQYNHEQLKSYNSTLPRLSTVAAPDHKIRQRSALFPGRADGGTEARRQNAEAGEV